MRFFIILILMCSCQPAKRSFKEIKESGVLKVVTRNTPTTYYEDRNGELAGLEYDMVMAYAKSLGLKVQFTIAESVEESLDLVRLGKVDLAAAGLTHTKQRETEFLFGPSYQEVSQQLICQKGKKAKSFDDLRKFSLVIVDGSSYQENLIKLSQKYPKIRWSIAEDNSSFLLIDEVARNKFDCTIADSNIIDVYRRYYPDLDVSLSLSRPENLGWIMHKKNKELKSSIEQWFKPFKRKNRLNKLKNEYYGFIKEFDSYDIKVFIKRIKSRLGKYKKLFQQAAKETGWEWTLLAAVSYQESHWNPRAISPTGVKGLMMLTKLTAKSMGVKNRLDPKESIFGGAHYLKMMETRIPSYIPKPDRFYMALASYNVGYAHLRDARGVAAWKEVNPNSWVGVREALPYLSQKSIYQRLPHGYARGLEPVIYVSRIRNYHELLLRNLGK